jgi:hypothetical protein
MMSASSVNPLSQPELEDVYERFERYSQMQHPLDWNHGIVGRILATLRATEDSVGQAHLYYEAACTELEKMVKARILLPSNEIESAFEAFMAHRIHGNAGTTLIVKEAFMAGAEWAQDAARNPEPKPEDGVLCTDCDKIVTDVKQIVVKGDKAVHFNCPAAERHGKLA